MSSLQPAVERIRSLVETYGLYRKLYIDEIFEGLDDVLRGTGQVPFYTLSPRMALLECTVCQENRTFNSNIGGVYGSADGGATSFRPPRVPTVGRTSRPAGPKVQSGEPPEIEVSPESPDSPLVIEAEVRHISMTCTYCQKGRYECWVEVRPDLGWIRKVGQVPRPETRVPPALRPALGEDQALYRKACECIASSFGIGACAYLRRLLEDRVNPLLRLLLEVRRSENAPEEELAEIEEVMTRTAFDEKAMVLYRRMPDSMKFGGDNPIKLLHKRLSEGLHSMHEDECVTVAVDGLRLFEYLVRELSREHDRMIEKASISEDMRKMRTLGGPG